MGERETRVSVVVSCYNYAAFLPVAVESALYQTHQNVEIIIVDDGSTDDTPEVAARLAEDPRVTYHRQTNQGQAAAKNAGIAKATGAFVAFLDADDRWHHEKLEKQLPLFEDPRVGMVFSRMRPIDPKGGAVTHRDSAPTRSPQRGRVTDALFIDNFIPFSSAVVRRSVFETVGVMDTDLAMGIDWDLWLRASVHFDFNYVDEELLDYRVGHVGQMSSRQEERYGWAEQIMERFLERYPGALSPDLINRAWAHTYNNRGYYYRGRDLGRSTLFYLRSLRVRLCQVNAYRGLLGNAWAGLRGSHS